MVVERSGDGREAGSTLSVALVVFSAALFGTTGVALAQTPDDVDPLSAGILRLLIGGSLLVVLARTEWRMVGRSRRHLFVGAVAVAVYQLGFFWAVSDTGVAAGTLVTIGVSPIASRLIARAGGRSAPPRSWYVAASVVIVGLGVMIVGGYENIELTLTGILIAIVAGFSFAGYTECGSRALAAGVPPDATMAALFFGGGVVSTPLLVWRGVDIVSTPTGLAVVAYLAVVTLTLAYMAFGRGLRQLSPTVVTTLVIVEPVVATVLSLLVLNEQFSSIGWIGAAIVVLGLPLVGRSAREMSRSDHPTTVRT